jgi:hypothetical protein
MVSPLAVRRHGWKVEKSLSLGRRRPSHILAALQPVPVVVDGGNHKPVLAPQLQHAKIELRQNGFLIYSTYVPPGPFRIDDLYSTTSNADIQVTVIEANVS